MRSRLAVVKTLSNEEIETPKSGVSTFDLIQSMKKSAAGSDEASRAFVENHLSSVVPHFQTVHAEPPSLAVALNADEPKEDPWIALPPLPSLSTVRDTLQSANSAPSSVTLGELKCLDNTTSSDLTKQNSKTKNSLQNSKNEPSEHSNGENTQKQVENNAIDSAEEHSLLLKRLPMLLNKILIV